jgi:hypothetical protein
VKEEDPKEIEQVNPERSGFRHSKTINVPKKNSLGTGMKFLLEK